MLIEDHDFYREFTAGMNEGELHAELDAIARSQGFGIAADNERAA